MSRRVVCVVEDDPAIRRGLVDSLKFAGYDVLECADGESARRTLLGADLDLVLLDVVLPGASGFDLLPELRASRPTLPVILVTARGGEEDRVHGLRIGADDYVVKPFSSTELLARVEAVLRRSAERPLDVRELRADGIVVNLERRELATQSGERHGLSEKEVEILSYLAGARDRAVSRPELLQRVWGLDPRGLDTRTVDMHVARLREKLGDSPTQPRFVVTVRSKGYMLADEVEVEPMSHVRRSWWWIFAAAGALALGGLGWVTRVALDLERAEVCARSDAGHQESLRLALWRMDSWLGPLLAAEASRPYFHYLPYYPQERAYTRILNAIEPGEVLSPSPLLTFRSEVFELHFQLDPEGRWTSPQAPTGNLLDLAQETLVAPEEIAAKARLLQQLPARIGSEDLEPALCEGEQSLVSLLDEEESVALAPPVPAQQRQQLDEAGRNSLEFKGRARSMWKNQVANEQAADNNVYALQTTVGEDQVSTGAMVPLWLGDTGSDPQLAYVRRVRVGTEEILQGVLVDWQRLERSLLAELGDLLAGARLVPRVDGDSSDLSLATLPAVLDAPAPPPPQVSGWTPARTTLLAGWICALLMLGAVGLTLHSSIVFGERRARFASAVTHELRTPLTTFRMYSEMLAKGMVGEERRAEYLETLCHESDRLSGLVENVLAYARLEEGRSPVQRRAVRVEELLERVRPELERRTDACGGELILDLDGAAETQVCTDPDAVGQILFNLVDNACKYGAPPFRISASRCGTDAQLSVPGLELRVEDAGPGVPAERTAAVFRPFDRGGRDEADGTSGIGLGLALARGLARDLGGELELEGRAPSSTFVLRLPGEGSGS